ncbi:MAG: hypothetical protein LAO30_07255 [Acidobacteriia bacterium]|nr:hypothetical protein [Terriglobia bacterium]
MKGISDITLMLRKTSPRLVKPASLVLAACVLAIAQSSSSPQIPDVRLDADGLAPRPIEELTGATIARHYAWAWRDLAQALESDQPDRLGEEFVGFAKDHLVQRVSEQRQTGVHVRIVDHGHHLKAIFYSTDGTAMQLLDQARLEIQTYDGNKLLDTQIAPHEYLVLITPGADRWYVRDLEEVSAKTF